MNHSPASTSDKSPPKAPPRADTREVILDTAEQLFAERGVDAVSIRDIIQAASLNLGAINYHFGTKGDLVAAVFVRRLGALNTRRLALLEEAEKMARGKAPAVDSILEALIRPAVESSFSAGAKNTSIMQLLGRAQSEPNAEIKQLIKTQFQTVMSRFGAALRRALPGLPEEELRWRMKFVFGALGHALLSGSRKDAPGKAGKPDPEKLIRRLVAFTVAGIIQERE